MGSLSLGEARKRPERARSTSGAPSEKAGGGFAIDPAELFRVFETQRSEQPAMEQDAGAASEALGQSGTSSTPQPAETNDIAVAFAVLGAELKDLLGLPVESGRPPNRISRVRRDKRPTSPNAMLNSLLNWLLCMRRRPKRL
jgi:hypothetical protein